MEQEEYLRAKREEMHKVYEAEDPWQFGANLYEKVRHDTMAEFVLSRSPESVLDLGCGEGHFLAQLLNRAPHLKVTGVELVPEAAGRCRTRLAKFGRKVKIVTADLLEFLSSGGGKGRIFEVVVCGDVLYYLPPDLVSARVVPGVTAMLGKGGGVVISSAGLNDDKRWTVDAFRSHFRLEKQVLIQPTKDFTVCNWVVSLLALEDKHEHSDGAQQPRDRRRQDTCDRTGASAASSGPSAATRNGCRLSRSGNGGAGAALRAESRRA